MKALIVSRPVLSDRILTELRKMGVDEFVDYFEHKKAWMSESELIDVAQKTECDSAVIIANFRVANVLLANGIKPVFVVMPVFATPIEIIKADVYAIDGEITIMHKRV